MSIQDVIEFLRRLGITKPIYPLAFPSSSKSEAMIVEVGQGFSSRGSVIETTLSVTVRAKHMGKGEEHSQDVIDALKDITDESIGNYQVILITSQQLVPQYLGADSEGNHFYMNNFKVLVSD